MYETLHDGRDLPGLTEGNPSKLPLFAPLARRDAPMGAADDLTASFARFRPDVPAVRDFEDAAAGGLHAGDSSGRLPTRHLWVEGDESEAESGWNRGGLCALAEDT